MSFVIKQKTTYPVEIFGEKYELHAPTVGQIKKLQEESKVEGNEFEALENLMVELGLKREVIENLEAPQLQSLVEHLSGGDKKK